LGPVRAGALAAVLLAVAADGDRPGPDNYIPLSLEVMDETSALWLAAIAIAIATVAGALSMAATVFVRYRAISRRRELEVFAPSQRSRFPGAGPGVDAPWPAASAGGVGPTPRGRFRQAETTPRPSKTVVVPREDGGGEGAQSRAPARSQRYLATGFVLGALAAVGAFFLGWEQDRIRSLYGPRPQTITLAELAARGYGKNVWLDLTDAEPGPSFVVESRNGSLTAVWVPAFPRGQAAQARSIQVILRSTRCKDEADIARHFEGRSKFRGSVINPVLLRPHDSYRPLLREHYPGHELPPTIWEVDIDDAGPPSPQWAAGFYAAAVGLAVVGLICGAGWLAGLRSPPAPE
jgi:hypothetical protein